MSFLVKQLKIATNLFWILVTQEVEMKRFLQGLKSSAWETSQDETIIKIQSFPLTTPKTNAWGTYTSLLLVWYPANFGYSRSHYIVKIRYRLFFRVVTIALSAWGNPDIGNSALCYNHIIIIIIRLYFPDLGKIRFGFGSNLEVGFQIFPKLYFWKYM